MSWIARFKAAWRMTGALEPTLLARAQELVRDCEARPESGEWKRHQVYARLIKEFPHTSRTSLAMAIEVAKCSG
jgi:hypothetical protein